MIHGAKLHGLRPGRPSGADSLRGPGHRFRISATSKRTSPLVGLADPYDREVCASDDACGSHEIHAISQRVDRLNGRSRIDLHRPRLSDSKSNTK